METNTNSKSVCEEDASKINKPTDDELANRWIDKHHRQVYGLGGFRVYKQGIWIGRPTKNVEYEILVELEAAEGEGIRPNISKVNSIRELIKIKINVPDSKWNNIRNCLPLRNGILDLSSLKFRHHDPKNYLTSKLSYNYDPTAKAPYWRKALSFLPPDVRDFLEEFAGLSLTRDTHYEIAVWLYGPSGCGKSTIIAGFQAMLGDRSIVLGPRDIESSRFNLSQIDEKTLMISTEQPSASVFMTDIYNKIISGEKINAEEKFERAYQMIPVAKILWAMTELPVIISVTDGLFRRVLVVEMPPIPEENRDPSFKDHIKQEGPGILIWAIEGLKRLLERGCFQIPESVRLASENFKQQNDLSKQFVEECCDTGLDFKVQARPLYDGYKRWCGNNGYTPKSMTLMADEWKRLMFTQSHSNGRIIWRGIKLKESSLIQVQEEKEILNNINREVSTVSTPSTILSTIPSEWYISETRKE
jgi:putative DNA primase/helicase